ncbi:MAG: hypothetical protein L3K19_07980 [Thermoplasmata archaeon]|nr:hypothetical protein [Thermoplasmata archaeon]
MNEILSAVDESGDLSTSEAGPGPGPARLVHPLRFPAIGTPRATGAPVERIRGLDALPALPALPAGAGFELYRHQVDEYLQLARRQGIELAEFSDRAKRAILVQDRESVEVLSRELFVFLAASLGEEFDAVCAQRNELAAFFPIATQDSELDACRQSLLLGDLSGTQRRLHRVASALADLQEHWETVQILLTEADLLAGTIRELGGDPTPALGPLEEGRRLAKEGQREAAEPLLARGTHALWTVLTPLFSREMQRSKEVLLKAREEGADVTLAVASMRELATHLRHRNFASGIISFRRLRESVDGLVQAAPSLGPGPDPPPEEKASPPPAG